MLRYLMLVTVCSSGLLALEVGMDPILDKAISDQFPRVERKMIYEILTQMEQRAAATPDSIFKELQISKTFEFDGLRKGIIGGDTTVAQVKDTYRFMQLSPEQQSAESHRRTEEMIKNFEKTGLLGNPKP